MFRLNLDMQNTESGYLCNLSLIQVTLSRIGNCCVVDPTPEEEACSASSLVMGVTPSGRVTTLRKMGSGSFHQQTLTAAIELGKYIFFSFTHYISARGIASIFV